MGSEERLGTNALEDYAERYSNIAMDRSDDGVLHLRFHCDGGPFVWCKSAHQEFEHAFREVGRDFDNRVIIMSATGEDFCGDVDLASWGSSVDEDGYKLAPGNPEEGMGRMAWERKQIIDSLLDIDVPIIAAVQGRCAIHPEIPLLSDVVLGAESLQISDDFHFVANAVPGDGLQVLWSELLGPNRGRYLQFVHQTLGAEQAREWGIVAEVLPSEKLMDRAWELAHMLATKRTLVLRNTRRACIRPLRRAYDDALDYGLALQFSAGGFTAVEHE